MSENAQQEEDLRASAATAEAIEAAFDGRWGIWLSGTGRWWAARQEIPGAPEPATARPATARTDTARTDTARTDTARTDTARTDTARTDTAGVVLVRADDPIQLKARILEQEARPEEARGPLLLANWEDARDPANREH